MKISDLSTEERQFLSTLVMERLQDASKAQYEQALLEQMLLNFIFTDNEIDPRTNGFLQVLMQEQSEIWGRESSTANEKQPVTLGQFVPQKTRQLVKSISTKLGASLAVDTTSPSFPVSPRAEGSPSIMTDPTLNK